MKKKIFRIGAVILAAALIAGCFSGCSGAEATEPLLFTLEGDAYDFDDTNGVSVHDPTLFRAEDGTYYLTGSHIASAKSEDLINWETVSSGVFDSNRTLVPEGSTLRESFAEAFAWCDAAQASWERSEDEWETNVWASDIIYNTAMEKYCYYACSSVWGTTASVIWFATCDNPEGPFEFENTIVYSGFDNKTNAAGNPKDGTHYSFTNLGTLIEEGVFTDKEIKKMDWFNSKGNYDCTYGMYPNAIDPAPFYDAEGNFWLAYGSYSGGIYIIPLIEETGMPDYDAMRENDEYDIYFGKQLSCTNEETQNTGEGSYIVYSADTGYYYMFITYGGLAALDGYNIREYRSEAPDGPYLDAAGNDARDMKSTGTEILGNYQFSYDDTAYLSPGHSSCLIDTDGKIYQAYHQRYNDGEGNYHNVQIHQMLATDDGWLAMLPTAYNGETAVPVTTEGIEGTYEAVIFTGETKATDSWDTVDSIIEPTVEVTIAGNTITVGGEECELNLLDGSYTFTFILNGETFRGAFCEGNVNGQSAMTFSAVSDKNESMLSVGA